MVKRLIFVFLLFIYSINCSSQTQAAIDLLHLQLRNAKDDTSIVNAEGLLCLLYRLGNTDSSKMYGLKALELAKRINYLPGQISCLGYMCIVIEQQGNLTNALDTGLKALRLADENHLERFTGPALDGIGEVYNVLNRYHEAIGYLHRYPLMDSTGPGKEGPAYAYLDLSISYAGLNRLDSADYFLDKSIATFHEYSYEEPLVYQARGDLEIKHKRPGSASLYYLKSLQLALAKNERRASAHAFNKLARYYRNLNPDSAIWYAQKGLEVSSAIEQKKSIMDAATLLSELYEQADARESLRYLKIANVYNDSLFSAGNVQAVLTVAGRETDRQKEIEAAKANYANQLKIYALGSIVAISLLIAFFLFRNSRRDKRARLVLQQKNETIEKTLSNLRSTQAQLIQSEKMASLGTLTAGIAHEIQNPLNFVNNFSEVNRELADEIKDAIKQGKNEDALKLAEDLLSNEDKINHHGKRADAIVKSMLLHSRGGAGEKELTDINAMAEEYLRLAYHGFKARNAAEKISARTDFNQAIPRLSIVQQDLGRVLLNLLNNAFYAVEEKKKLEPNGYNPEVILSTRNSGNRIEISVRDNGIGIPAKNLDKIFQPFFTTKPTGSGTGLGLSLSYDIVKAQGGEIKVQSTEGEGSEFIIALPV
jgi:signal transduction histidine kinase